MIGGAFLDAVTDVPRLRAAFLRLETERDEAERNVAERIDTQKADAVARDDQVSDIYTALFIAGPLRERLAQLAERLDAHQLAVIEALQNNREELDLAEGQVDELLDRAYVLPDGRRVFKSEDGTRIYDEFGRELGDDEVDVNEIGDDTPNWEQYSAKVRKRDQLQTTRDKLLSYQERLDQAEEKIRNGTLSESEADDLDVMLDNPPDLMRRYLPDTDSAYRRAGLSPATVDADTLDLDDTAVATVETSEPDDLALG